MQNFEGIPRGKIYITKAMPKVIYLPGAVVLTKFLAVHGADLIGVLLAQRWQLWIDAKKQDKDFDYMVEWEEGWITSEWKK